jgi:hypothetical protein
MVLPPVELGQRAAWAPSLFFEGERCAVHALAQAGGCGSSKYRCNSPGFTCCCGNSADGFSCAAVVNGCTKQSCLSAHAARPQAQPRGRASLRPSSRIST